MHITSILNINKYADLTAKRGEGKQMKYEKTNEDIWTVSRGTFRDGTQWRIQKVAGVYYYGVLRHITDANGGSSYTAWVDSYRSTELAKVLEARNNDPLNGGDPSILCNVWEILIRYNGEIKRKYYADSFVVTDDRVLKIYSRDFGNVTDKITTDETLYISNMEFYK